MKKIFLLALVLLSTLCFAVGCGGGEEHTHNFDKQVASEQYLLKGATCEEKAEYYYSCSCGEKGAETFEYGQELGHSFTNYIYNDNAKYDEDGTETAVCENGCGVNDTRSKKDSAIAFSIFKISGGEITGVTDYGKTIAELVIPNTINGVKITSIGSAAFYYCTSLKSIEIPNSIERIGTKAFSFCMSLTSVVIPDSVISIGQSAFHDCTSLKSIVIPDSVISIGQSAFCDCSSLISVTIGNGVTCLSDYMFEGCSNLIKVNYTGTIDDWAQIEFGTFSANPLHFAKNLYINDVLVTEANISTATKISSYAFCNCSALTSVVTGESVISIGDYAFYDCWALTNVVIPNSVTSIREKAFSGCPIEKATIQAFAISQIPKESLKEVIIIGGESISNGAFYKCKSLTSVVIGDSVTSIGERAFSVCTSLTSVIIGSGVTSIGSWAFSACALLISIVIPDSVISIGENAFSACDLIKSIAIPDNVTSIGSYAFYSCDSLTSATISGKTSIGRYAFSNCKSLKTVTIDNSITSIGERAFEDCSSLVSVTMGNSVTSIGDFAFHGCSSLTSIVIPYNVISIGYDAFLGCESLKSATFENPNGWWCLISSTDTSGTSISHSYLSDTTTAAQYLRFTNYYWKRG